MTPEWVEIIKIVFGFLTVSFGGIITLLVARLTQSSAHAATKVEEAAVKVEEVKSVLETTTNNTDQKLNAIHTLVNGAMTAQMKIGAIALRRLAILSGDDDDVKAADLAETAYREHEAKQVVVL